MLTYSKLKATWKAASPKGDYDTVFEYLAPHWIKDYQQRLGSAKCDIVEVFDNDFSYLFDIPQGRLIAACGVSNGKNTEPRPAQRMKGHPLGAAKGYHRGHAIPHTLGGGTDINLVPQLGSLNTGKFRVLEIKAVNTPGAFYFTYWEYKGGGTQLPCSVQQGLLCPGQDPEIYQFMN